ncbi:hypothetical protein I7I53_01003 [Histoplasma capsulatum var. duboisii H88]|uniref:Uncharacterized protein n=1 Tax=Ajellomyces capsulatus (strain H88) TaxID=544711 RepID=A0A8A1LIC4_AJEC8|nr:hypothetical protein I7I53_01003 [Histoplasma capsulatum var. duboisii H88]
MSANVALTALCNFDESRVDIMASHAGRRGVGLRGGYLGKWRHNEGEDCHSHVPVSRYGMLDWLCSRFRISSKEETFFLQRKVVY